MFNNYVEIFIGLHWKSLLFQIRSLPIPFVKLECPISLGRKNHPISCYYGERQKEPPPRCVTKVNLEVWGAMGLLAVKTQISITPFIHYRITLYWW